MSNTIRFDITAEDKAFWGADDVVAKEAVNEVIYPVCQFVGHDDEGFAVYTGFVK